MSEQETRPPLRIVRGEPTAEELAALAAVISATGSDEPVDEPAPTRGRWNDPAHAHRRYWQPGPGGWRAATY